MRLFCARHDGVDGSAAVYALLRYAMKAELDIELPLIKRAPGGKPFFPELPDVFFSLSHTSSHVMCGISERPIGVDVEKIRPVRSGIESRVCSPDERQQFDFFELWVLKESFIKLNGKLETSLSEISFRREGSDIVSVRDPTVTARLYDGAEGCCAAICTRGDALPPGMEIVDLYEIRDLC